MNLELLKGFNLLNEEELQRVNGGSSGHDLDVDGSTCITPAFSITYDDETGNIDVSICFGGSNFQDHISPTNDPGEFWYWNGTP